MFVLISQKINDKNVFDTAIMLNFGKTKVAKEECYCVKKYIYSES